MGAYPRQLPPLTPALFDGLTAPERHILTTIAAIGADHNTPVWIVGGVVRDLLLDVPRSFDIDIAVEGLPMPCAETLVRTLGGTILASHTAFGTATLTIPLHDTTYTIDLARTRRESYPEPAALPRVTPAPITDDLQRRDFSINAMAAALHHHAGTLAIGHILDQFNGWHDLHHGLLRVLHPQSFRDDPTRILRGLRQASRMHLTWAATTHSLLTQAVDYGYLARTSVDRLRNELCLALAEPNPAAVWQHAAAVGVAQQLLPDLGDIAAPLRQHAAHPDTPSLVRAGLLTYTLTPPARERLINSYRLPGEAARVIREVGELQPLVPQLAAPDLAASTLDRLLYAFHAASLQVLMRAVPNTTVQQRIQTYTTTLRTVAPLLNGNDLQHLGVAPGPAMGAILRGLRTARLDAMVQSRADEIAWVQAYLQQHPPTTPATAPKPHPAQRNERNTNDYD